jgi:hypothetical protein
MEASRTEGVVRLLLKHHPEAAALCGVVPADDTSATGSCYDFAVEKGLPKHIRRLLLRAAPDLNRDEYHRLNYTDRRMAMFLAFRAVPKDSSKTDMKKKVKNPFISGLRLLGLDQERALLRQIVSYL